MNGTITIQHTIWCCSCEAWDTISGTRRQCVNEWVERGWGFRRGEDGGWVCGLCAWPDDISRAQGKKRIKKANANVLAPRK